MTAPKRMTQRDLQEEHGGAGVYSRPLQEHWELSKPEWANDMIPEIMDGKNIADFVDPDIERRLEELEAEEEQRVELAKLEKEQEGVEMDDEEAAQVMPARPFPSSSAPPLASTPPLTSRASLQVSRLAERIRRKKALSKPPRRRAAPPTTDDEAGTKRGERSVEAFVQHMGGRASPRRRPPPQPLEGARARRRASPRRAAARSSAAARAAATTRWTSRAAARWRRRRCVATGSRKSALRRDAAAAARSRSPSRVGPKDESALKRRRSWRRRSSSR